MRGLYSRRNDYAEIFYYQLIVGAREKCYQEVTPDGATTRPETSRGKALAD
jgi:hypothetical protein